MATATLNNSSKLSSSNNWKSLTSDYPQSITVDDIITAYEKGCDEGFSAYMRKMKKEIKNKLSAAMDVVADFFNKENEDREIFKCMMLRVSYIDKFDFIITMNPEDFSNDEIARPIYEKSFVLRRLNPTINISFMPATDFINKESLEADKYLVMYGKIDQP